MQQELTFARDEAATDFATVAASASVSAPETATWQSR